MSRRLSLTLVLAVAVAPAIPAWADLPTQLPAERLTEPLDAEDFLVFLSVERTAEDAEVLLFFEQNEARDSFTVLRVTDAVTEIHRVREGVAELTHQRAGVFPPDNDVFELTVRRRDPHVVVSAEGGIPAHFLAEQFCGTQIGAAAVRNADVSDLFVQPLGDVIFDEDFFATEQVPERWETLAGSWEVGIYWDPLQERDDRPIGSAWYEPGEGLCLTAAGHDFWDSYRLSVTVGLEQGRGGAAFHVRGPDDYCVFEVGEDAARLVEVRGGERIVLSEERFDLRSDWWYELRVDVSTGYAQAFINDEEVVAAEFPPDLIGRIGLYADDAEGSRFDDVQARPFETRRIPPAAVPEEALGLADETWQIEEGVIGGHTAETEVATVVGSSGDNEISATVGATTDAIAGIVLGHRPEEPKSALIFSIHATEDPTWQLHHVSGDQTTRVSGGPAPAASGQMTLRFVGGHVTCLLDEETVYETYIAAHLPGRAGAYLQGGRASFADFTSRELADEPSAVISRVDGGNTPVPALERQEMVPPLPTLWQPQSGSWECREIDAEPLIVASDDGNGEPTVRYREMIPGEPRLIVDPAEDTDVTVRLGICMGEEPGYEVEFNETQSGFRFLRRGEVIHESDEGAAGGCAPGEIRRAEDWIVIGGRADGEMRTMLAWRDPDPLPDGYAEVGAGGNARFRSITLASNSALQYTFDHLETDWQPHSGEWTDHTGMACLLWDYWLTGDGREEPAFTWNRHAMPENVVVDFSVAEFTEGYADGRHEHFPYHDISVILGSEAGDQDSGYRFIVGADEGRRNVLLRNGEEVASNDDRRFRIVMGGHHNTPRAVRISAQRAHDTLTLTFNGAEVIRWSDPEPLTGGKHVGMGIDGCRAIFRDCLIFPRVRPEPR